MSKDMALSRQIGEINQQPLVYRGVRCITLPLMDDLHDRPAGTAGRNFRKHRGRLVEGEDYFEIPYLEWSNFEATNFVGSSHGGKRDSIYVLTESGYCLLVKSFQDDLAWSVQKQIVKGYFRCNANSHAIEYHMAAINQYLMEQQQATVLRVEKNETTLTDHERRLRDLEAKTTNEQKEAAVVANLVRRERGEPQYKLGTGDIIDVLQRDQGVVVEVKVYRKWRDAVRQVNDYEHKLPGVWKRRIHLFGDCSYSLRKEIELYCEQAGIICTWAHREDIVMPSKNYPLFPEMEFDEPA